MPKIVAISDGHGENTAGKRTPPFPDGTVMKENEFNRAVVDLLEKHLVRNGFKVVQVAPELEHVPLETRVRRANEAKADIFVAVHANAFKGEWGDWGGIDTFVWKKGFEAEKLAKQVHKNLMLGTPLRDRGIKEANFYVLRKTHMPAILVECGFMDNFFEAQLLRTLEYRQECAREIARGICEYYRQPYITEEAEKIDRLQQFIDKLTKLMQEYYLEKG